MSKFCSECGCEVGENANFCVKCGTPRRDKSGSKPEWQSKREKVLGSPQKRTRSIKMFLWTTALAVFAGWVYFNLPESGNPIIKSSPTIASPVSYSTEAQPMVPVQAIVQDGKIVLPLDLLKEKRFVKFFYGEPESSVPMLAYISGEGKVVTAISVCEPCNSTDFHIKEDKVICNSCGSTWELNTLKAVSGSCGRYPPDAVPNAVANGKIQIDEQVVSQWRRRV